MRKEDYNRMDDKLDRQTKLLMDIKDDINREISFIKLAHQRLKYAVTSIGVIVMLTLTIEYPKLIKFVKSLL